MDGMETINALIQVISFLLLLFRAAARSLLSRFCRCPCHRNSCDSSLKDEVIAKLEEEIEKERSASATSAQEAMAMICRLQEEKAQLMLEARQSRLAAEQKQLHHIQSIAFLRDLVCNLEQERNTCYSTFEGRIPVLILGAGPVGYFLLNKLGVKCFVVEKNCEIRDNPQAHLINNISMEILRKLDGFAQNIEELQSLLDQQRKFVYCSSRLGLL